MPTQALLECSVNTRMTISLQHNPFATRFTQPGVIPFLLPDGGDLQAIVNAFRSHRFLGQIVGSHGCGKTTLTHAMQSLLLDHFQSIRRIVIRDTRHVNRNELVTSELARSPNHLLVVDGFERLPWLHRRLLLKHVRDQKIGLLFTSHRPIQGVPVIYEIQPTLETLRCLTDELAPFHAIHKNMLASTFETNGGNIRECLMTLYNALESGDQSLGGQDD